MALLIPPSKAWAEKLEKHMATLTEADDEGERIIAHRVRYLRRLGLPWDQATALGSRYHGPDSIDVHRVEALIKKGATPAQAARIA